MKQDNHCLMQLLITCFCIQMTSAGVSQQYDPSKKCQWESSTLNVEDLSRPTVLFDEFRNSRDSEIKVVDTYNYTILSPMFLNRAPYSVDIEDLTRTSAVDCKWYKDRIDSGYENSYRNLCLEVIEATWLQLLDLSNNNFQTIHSNSFMKIATCLNYLILKNNQISAIESLAFNDLHDLTYLDLSHNNISSFDINSVKDSPLEYLNLAFNYLSTIKCEIQNNLVSLQLSNNLLSTFESLQMLKLKQLDLSHNKLTDFKVNSIPALTTLNLSYNKLKKFVSIGSLTELHLSHNKIVNFSCTEDQILVNLDLSYNKISHFNSNIFKYLSLLQALDLSHNNLNLISDMFNDLRSLRTLSLQNNHLAVVPPNTFLGLESLKDLDLSQNYFDQFQFGSFFGIKQLQKLDLSYNKIKEVEFDKLLDLNNLTELIIDGNNCTLELSDLHFKLPALSIMSLGHIPWKCNDLVRLTVSLRKLHIETLSKIHKDDFKSAVNGIACYSGEELPQILTYESIEHINSDSSQDFNDSQQEGSSTLANMVINPTMSEIVDANGTEPLLQLFKQAIRDIVVGETNKIRSDLTEQIRNSTWTILQKIDNSMAPKLHTKLLIEKDTEPTYADYVIDEIP